jgi:hypothetical protein
VKGFAKSRQVFKEKEEEVVHSLCKVFVKKRTKAL